MAVLHVVFWVCAIVGFVILLLNVLLGWMGSALDLGFESDLDIDGVFPFNILCLCLFLIVFGALGIAVERWMTSLIATILLMLLISGAGAGAYALLYCFVIQKLRSSNPVALSYADLLGERGEVILRVKGEEYGMISVRDSIGAAISFRAKIDPELREYVGETIPQGTIVVVTEVCAEAKFCYVSTPEGSAIKHRKDG